MNFLIAGCISRPDSWGCCSRVDALVGCFCRKHSPASANPRLETRTGHEWTSVAFNHLMIHVWLQLFDWKTQVLLDHLKLLSSEAHCIFALQEIRGLFCLLSFSDFVGVWGFNSYRLDIQVHCFWKIIANAVLIRPYARIYQISSSRQEPAISSELKAASKWGQFLEVESWLLGFTQSNIIDALHSGSSKRTTHLLCTMAWARFLCFNVRCTK